MVSVKEPIRLVERGLEGDNLSSRRELNGSIAFCCPPYGKAKTQMTRTNPEGESVCGRVGWGSLD